MKAFYNLTRFLRKSFNFQRAIHIRRVDLPIGKDGDATCKKNRYLIRISKSLPENYAIEVLLHEFAHCLAWEKYDCGEDHCHSWGKAYSEVYRTFLKWDFKN